MCRRTAILLILAPLFPPTLVPGQDPFEDPMEPQAIARMGELAQALERCAADTGFFVPLEALNDTTNPAADPPGDYLNDQGGVHAIDPGRGSFLEGRQDLSGAWGGPYVTYGPGEVQPPEGPYEAGSPLDPWGEPYYLFSPLGLVRGDSGTLTADIFGDGFERFTIVSLGPGSVPGGGNDLVYQLGAAPAGPSLAGMQGPDVVREGALHQVTAGAEVQLRGYGLGPAQTDAALLFGPSELFDIGLWRDTRIELTLPTDVEGREDLFVERGPERSNALDVEISIPQNAALDWAVYP